MNAQDVPGEPPARITLDDWTRLYPRLRSAGLCEPSYGGPLIRHFEDGDSRLGKLMFDNSPAALRLWNLLLTEEERLWEARAEGKVLIGVMKDLGTAAVLAYGVPGIVAFYPDGAWWTPCIMEHNARLLAIADSLGLPESFCPVRAMLGAFVNGEHFPIPDLLVCSVGATCDDFSAIAQRLEGLGHRIVWWEMPHRRLPSADEQAVSLPGDPSEDTECAPSSIDGTSICGTGVSPVQTRAGRPCHKGQVSLRSHLVAPAEQVQCVEMELRRVGQEIAAARGCELSEPSVAAAIRHANRTRGILAELRERVFAADPCPMPALEMLIAEMLAIHYCSDPAEALLVLADLLAEVRRRVAAGVGVLPENAVRVYWVNPVADLRVMNLIEDAGGRICGTDFMLAHALAPIDESDAPLRALAKSALADPMVGSAGQRAERICREVERFGARAVVISRIPGASHCATEGAIIGRIVRTRLDVPVVEIEVPSITDAIEPGLRTRLEALIETARGRSNK